MVMCWTKSRYVDLSYQMIRTHQSSLMMRNGRMLRQKSKVTVLKKKKKATDRVLAGGVFGLLYQ